MKRLTLIALALFVATCASPRVGNNAEAYNIRGSSYLKEGQYDQAISDCTKAIDLDPIYADAYNNRGLAYVGKDQNDKAISDCTKALELDPRYADAHSNRGYAYFRKGQYDQAISDCTKAIELNPRHAMAYNIRGGAYFRKGLDNQAISEYTKAIELYPRFAEAHVNRGLAYYLKGEYDKGRQDLRKAESLGLTLRPEVIEDFLIASELKFEQLGDLLGAEKAFENNIDTQEECEDDCRKMFQKGELREGITVEECIKVLCK